MTDLDHPTNPDAAVTLLMRFETAFGSRTVVANGLSARDAKLIGAVLSATGHHVQFKGETGKLSLEGHVKALRRRLRAISKSNVISIKSKQVPRHG